MKYLNLILLIALFNFGCNHQNDQEDSTNMKTSEIYTKVNDMQNAPPVAKMVEKKMVIHDDVRIDPYYWMNDREDPDVIAYLDSENTYRENIMSHLKNYQEKLYEEIKGRVKQTDMSVPYKENGYFYFTRYEEGKEYPIHARRKGHLDAPEEIMLNLNELAKPYSYFAVGGRSVSPNNEMLAYGEDTLSRRIYTLRFKNLKTGKMLADIIPNTSGSAVWANDNETIFYSVKDETLRPFKIYKHKLGTDAKDDELVYHEVDETFNTFVYKSKSKKYIISGSYATLSTEYRILPADQPNAEWKIFQPRENKLEYSINHHGSKFYVRTNLDAKNFRLMETPEASTEKENWKEIIPNRADVLLEGIDIFNDFKVLSERKNGITQLRVMPERGADYYIDFGEDAYLAFTSANPEFDTDILRIGYQSLTTPNTTYDFNMNTKDKILLKEQEVLGGFDRTNYVSERIYVTARDGAKVPVSLVHHKNVKIDGSNPCLLYGYGSYGASMDPYFSHVRLSILDRGFVFAIAHIRGGEEMGRQWYEDGKLLKKKNTFTDFIDCGQYLIDQGYAKKDLLFASGGSAGGLLMGAVMNMKPDMWKGVIAAVPFVDVVTTMLDETIPLTTGEYDEWGNPNNEAYYEYMKSYSPYDNIEKKAYPATLVTTGLHDSQVQYWEPAKWVAKLRAYKTDNNPLLLYCNMETGHGGASGRFERYKESAMEYAFLLDLAGKLEMDIKG